LSSSFSCPCSSSSSSSSSQFYVNSLSSPRPSIFLSSKIAPLCAIGLCSNFPKLNL
jgi:hypothetical protein